MATSPPANRLAERLRRYMPIAQALLFVAPALVLGVLSYQHLADAKTLPIKEVRVEGEFRYLTPESLEERVVNVVTGGFFNVDVTIIKRVLQKEPWVSHVSVRRVWPDTLKVEVHERVAIARWGESGLMDSDAEVFYPTAATFPEGLISLNAPQGTEHMVLQHFELLETQLESLGLSVQQMDLSDRRAWSFVLKQGPSVILGREEFENRVDRFVKVYQKVLKPEFEQIETVDLRYTNGLAVRWDKTKTASGKG